MSTITNAETLEARAQGSIVKYVFRYTVSTGEVHTRRAWVPNTVNEVTERTARGEYLLYELAEAEAAAVIV